MTDGLNRFYEIKERKIRTYIEYLSEIGLTTNDEKAEIDKIGKGWQNARNSISAFQKKLERSDFVAISNLNTGTDFKDELTEYTQQIIEPLEKLEQRLRTRTLDQIRVIINSNQQSMPSGSKFFFDLFTKSPYN